MQYQIISDSSCDLPEDIVKENKIGVVPFYISFDQKDYKKEGEEINIREFYQKMVDHPGVYPKTSLPSVQDYIDTFMPFVKEGIPVICICITTKFSGSYNSARNAREVILEDYPNARIEVVDAQVNTVLQGLLVLETVKMQKAGYSIEKTLEVIEKIKQTGRIIFTIGSMDYLQIGGRIGKLMGGAANLLKIKPLIILREGEIFPLGFSRSRSKSKTGLLEHTKKHFEDSGENPDDYEFCVGFGYDAKEAEEFCTQLEQSLAAYSSARSIKIYQIGGTIGVHTGPYPIGLGLIKKYDRI